MQGAPRASHLHRPRLHARLPRLPCHAVPRAQEAGGPRRRVGFVFCIASGGSTQPLVKRTNTTPRTTLVELTTLVAFTLGPSHLWAGGLTPRQRFHISPDHITPPDGQQPDRARSTHRPTDASRACLRPSVSGQARGRSTRVVEWQGMHRP